MNQYQAPAQADYTEKLVDRLVENYLAANEVPSGAESGKQLTPALFHKIFRAIQAEGYGEK